MKAVGALAMILALALPVGAQEESVAARFAKFGSPDGLFVLRAVEEDGIVNRVIVVEAEGREVADLTDDIMISQPEEVSLVWAKDSKSFAANVRAGGRYNAMEFFRWKGDAFAKMESPESDLYETIVAPARKRELKAAGMAESTYLRRIWDSWQTMKWTDANTAEIHGESTAAYYVDEEPNDIAIAVDATVKFDGDGKPKILKSAEVPAKD